MTQGTTGEFSSERQCLGAGKVRQEILAGQRWVHQNSGSQQWNCRFLTDGLITWSDLNSCPYNYNSKAGSVGDLMYNCRLIMASRHDAAEEEEVKAVDISLS